MSDEPMIPKGIFFPDPDSEYMDTWFTNHYSNILREANEPSIWKLAETKGYHEYRFYFDESRYSYGPVIVRLSTQVDDRAIATVNILKSVPDNPDTYYPEYRKALEIHKTITVSKKNMEKFFVQLEKINFWQSPTNDPDTTISTDGSSWYIEAAKDTKYHFIERHSPDDKPMVELGMLFMQLAKLSGWKRHIRRTSSRNPDRLLDFITWVLLKVASIPSIFKRR